jgi:hypothetical protein
MNRRTLWVLSAIAFLTLPLWGKLLSALGLLNPDADQLTRYFINKGLFAVALLAMLAKWDGLRNYGFKRGKSWWFLLPAAPILILTTLVMANPEAQYGFDLVTALGWILVTIFIGIGEEGLFRGLLWRALEERGVLTTSLVTSVLFGSIHLGWVFEGMPLHIVASQVVFGVGMGMMFAAVRLVSGSLLAAILLHAFFDSGMLIASGGVQEIYDDTMSVARLLVPGIAFFAWGLICILVVQRRRTTRAIPSTTEVPRSAP